MPAFVVVEIEIHDPESYVEYARLAPPSIAKYDGRYVLRVVDGPSFDPRGS